MKKKISNLFKLGFFYIFWFINFCINSWFIVTVSQPYSLSLKTSAHNKNKCTKEQIAGCMRERQGRDIQWDGHSDWKINFFTIGEWQIRCCLAACHKGESAVYTETSIHYYDIWFIQWLEDWGEQIQCNNLHWPLNEIYPPSPKVQHYFNKCFLSTWCNLWVKYKMNVGHFDLFSVLIVVSFFLLHNLCFRNLETRKERKVESPIWRIWRRRWWPAAAVHTRRRWRRWRWWQRRGRDLGEGWESRNVTWGGPDVVSGERRQVAWTIKEVGATMWLSNWHSVQAVWFTLWKKEEKKKRNESSIKDESCWLTGHRGPLTSLHRNYIFSLLSSLWLVVGYLDDWKEKTSQNHQTTICLCLWVILCNAAIFPILFCPFQILRERRNNEQMDQWTAPDRRKHRQLDRWSNRCITG